MRKMWAVFILGVAAAMDSKSGTSPSFTDFLQPIHDFSLKSR